MRRYFDKLPISAIDAEEEPFRVTFPGKEAELARSIKEVGLLHPLTLRESRRGGKYEVVCGYGRLRAVTAACLGEVSAYCYSAEVMDDLSALKLNLAENVSSRQLNIVEKGEALRKLSLSFGVPRREIINDYMPRLELEPSPKVLDDLLAIVELERDMKLYIVERGIAPGVAARLASFRGDDRRKLFDLVQNLRLGTGMMRDVLELLEEVSLRDGQPVGQILGDSALRDIISSHDLTSSQKAARLKLMLRKIRYPRLSLLDERFVAIRKKLAFRPGLSLEAPPFFEGDWLKAEFRFSRAEELEAFARELLEASRKTEISELLDLV